MYPLTTFLAKKEVSESFSLFFIFLNNYINKHIIIFKYIYDKDPYLQDLLTNTFILQKQEIH